MALRAAILAVFSMPLVGLACSTFGTDTAAGASAEASAPLDASAAPDGAIPDGAIPDGAIPEDAIADRASADSADSADLDGAIPEDASVADAPQDTNRVDAAVTKKRVFLTTAAFPGTFAFGIFAGAQLEADARCAAEATALGSTWYAYLSIPTVSAASRLPDDVAWHLPGPVVGDFGARVFASRAAIALGPEVPITLGADGLSAIEAGKDDAVWTGTLMNTAVDLSGHCTLWTSDSTQGRIGSAAGLRGSWTDVNTANCGKTARFYCFER